MAQEADIPPDVRRFIDGHIGSIEQLEVLRVLAEDPEREWTLTALAQAAQMQPTALATQLAVLEGHGLLKKRELAVDVLCRLDPQPAAAAMALGKLLQLYNERPVTLINFFYGRKN